MTTDKQKSVRAWELDALRGFAIILVVWDHTMFDLSSMFNFGWLSHFAAFYESSWLRFIFWPVFVFIFFFVSGICTVWSKNNFVRGLKLAAVAIGLTLVTLAADAMFDMGVLILFGVLHCLAACILVYAVLAWLIKICCGKQKNFNRIQSAVYLIVAVLLMIAHFVFNTSLYADDMYNSAAVSEHLGLGLLIYTRDFWRLTADYFPLLPFLSFFMLGAGLSPLLYADKKSLFAQADGSWNKVFTWCGRYSLLVYLASQVIVVALLYGISFLMQ